MLEPEMINEEKTYEFFNALAYKVDHPLRNKLGESSININEDNVNGFNIHAYLDIHKQIKNLKLVYDNEKSLMCINVINDIQIIFNKYFSIMGIERLVATNYTDIEWTMYLEHNFDKSEPQRTRDHFLHQFRNAFLGCTLLNKFNLDKIIIKCIEEKQSPFSYIVNRSITLAEKKGELANKKSNDIYNEIIYKSYILSAIFHDIGYPISYFNRVASQIHNFTPFYELINSNIKTDFTKIKSLLADSMLLLTVDNDEIRTKYEENDHGAFSAMSFLLNFYSTGSIYGISEINRCIIELAAIAIYNHTNKYKDDNRMVFYNDPISYLLRLCNDLQEWSRFSLRIDTNNNYLRCNKCLGIILPIQVSEKSDKHKNVIYQCNSCGIYFNKITHIDYKKINHIEFCEELIIREANDEINIKVDYDPYIQLELLVNDYLAVNFRDKDLKKVERMLEFQKYLPIININWELSNNPYMLVKWILRNRGFDIDSIIVDDLLVINELKINKKICEDFISEIKELRENGFGDVKIHIDNNELHDRSKEFVLKYIGVIECINSYEKLNR